MGKEKLKKIIDKAQGNEKEIQNNGTNKCDTRAVSASSIKSRKSSNILAAFVRKTWKLKNKEAENVAKSANSSNNILNVASIYSLSTHSEEEVELNNQYYEDPVVSSEMHTKQTSKQNVKTCFTTDSEYSLTENQRSCRHTNSTKKSVPLADPATKPTCSVCHCDSKPPSNSVLETNVLNEPSFTTCYINYEKNGLSSALSTALQTLQDLTTRLYESESHLVQIFTRYVEDPSFKQELLETLSCHSKLQWETERRTTSLVSEIWAQQTECGRAQEKALQETLNSLVKQNRQVQVENEILFRKHEKVLRKLRNVGDVNIKYKSVASDLQLDHIFRHNEKLQHKLETVFKDMDSLESELHMLQRHNESLEGQLKNSSATVYNLKTLVNRTKTDYDLEIIKVNHVLQKNEKIIRDAMEAGDVLLEDMERLKQQSDNYGLNINWSKFKSRGTSPTELIHLSRSFINELAKEIFSLSTQLVLKDKDIDSLQQTNAKLQENLQNSVCQLDNLSRKIEKDLSQESEKILYEQKCHTLITDLKTLEAQMEQLKSKHETEKMSLMSTITGYEQLHSEVNEKDKVIDQSKQFICNIAAENMLLRNQIDHLNRLLSESGAGDVLRELNRNQDDLTYYQTQYHKLLNDKELLLEQQKDLKETKRAILEQQEQNLKQLHERLIVLETSQKENIQLRQQLEAEHQTVMTLQNERMKHLEEKDLLKTLFHRMKTELSRVQQLENAITEITKEASKLALIAEYNKQLGKKLKSEVSEKDKTITMLKSSVEKLNDIQLKDTKEKMSLCYELSEVCQMKNQLTNILSAEMEKTSQLDTSKKELLQNAKSKLKKFEEVQQNDRTILKDIAREMKFVIQQKDTLQKEKEELQEELNKIKLELEQQVAKYDNLLFIKNELDINNKEVLAKYSENEKVIKTLQEQINNENVRYNEDVGQLKKLIVELRKEQEEADSSIRYLQNNTQRLHNDLNESRKNEKELQNELKRHIQENKNLIQENQSIIKKVESLNLDKCKMAEELQTLNIMCERVLETLEVNTRTSKEKETLYKKELEELRHLLINSSKEYENIKQKLFIKGNETEKLHNDCRQKEDQIVKLEKTLEEQNAELIETKNRLKCIEKDFDEINCEYNNVKYHNDGIYQECSVLKDKLHVVIDQKERESLMLQAQLQDALNAKNKIEEEYKLKMKDFIEINDLAAKLEVEKSSYKSLCQIHQEFKDKFAKYVKEAQGERNAKEQVKAQLETTERHLETLQVEKLDLQQQINILLDGLNESKNRINSLAQEKENLQKGHEALQKRYNELLQKCILLENKLREAELNQSAMFHNSEVEILKEKIKDMKFEATENHYIIDTLKEDITSLEQKITGCELQKSELTLKLHEIQRKYETEYNLCEKLKSTQRQILSAILRMRQDGKIGTSDSNDLVGIVQNVSEESENYMCNSPAK